MTEGVKLVESSSKHWDTHRLADCIIVAPALLKVFNAALWFSSLQKMMDRLNKTS